MQVGVKIPILDWGKRRGKVRESDKNNTNNNRARKCASDAPHLWNFERRSGPAKRAGYEAQVVPGPREAIEVVRTVAPDLILMDMNFTLSTTGEEGLTLL